MAPLVFTVVVDTTGSFRQAILSLVLLFAAGLALLLRTDTDEAAREAAASGPGSPGSDIPSTQEAHAT
jgi:UMF1 family MFS transporter